MNILYTSVHAILEDDEVRLFQGLGHNVFLLGVNNRHKQNQSYRPSLDLNATENHLCDIYEGLGGKYSAASSADEFLPLDFVGHFSLSIIMHDPMIILNHWHKLYHRPVLWRTIGQGVDHYEIHLKVVRDQNLRIVRYSEMEKDLPDGLGEDAIIRFSKDPKYYKGWSGTGKYILTFSNSYEDRYPIEYAAYEKITQDLPSVLGGSGNGYAPGAIGFVQFSGAA